MSTYFILWVKIQAAKPENNSGWLLTFQRIFAFDDTRVYFK